MTTKTLQVIIYTAVLAAGATQARTQQRFPIHRNEHRRTAKATEYARASSYFHYQELAFRAKAQELLNQYCREAGRYAMATKTVTHAAAVTLRFNEYESKANENARLAATYDEMLQAMGFEPVDLPHVIVSRKDLQQNSRSEVGN